MKKGLAVLVWTMFASACVPAAYLQSMPPGYPARPTYGPAVHYQTPAPPIGRWDNVMMLAAGASVQVLRMDGGVASGRVVAADAISLRLQVAAGQVDLAAGDVMRVDRLEGGGTIVTDGAKGAAVGAGVVGVLGLIAGQVPPPRLFAAGGIAGAYHNVELGAAARGATTIYLAAVVPAAPPSAPRAVRR
jgi:hypothetical protein